MRQRVLQMRKRTRIARAAERVHGLRFDEVTRVAFFQHAGERRGGIAIATKFTQRASDRAPRLRMREREALDQRVARVGGPHGAERGGRIGLHAPEFVIEHRLAQRGDRLRTSFAAQLARGLGTTDRLGRMLEDFLQRLAPALMLEGLEHIEAGIDANRFGSRLGRQMKDVVLLLDLHLMAHFVAVGIHQRDRDRKAKHRRRVRGLVGLLDGDAGELLLVVVAARNLQLRMAFLVDPLIEKEIQVAPGRILEGALQVLRNHIVATMARAVEIERFEKQLVADRAPQHVQDQAALLI